MQELGDEQLEFCISQQWYYQVKVLRSAACPKGEVVTDLTVDVETAHKEHMHLVKQK